MSDKDTLSILQYNVRKSKDTVMATMLRDPRIAEFDILAVQEPWRNPFMATTHHPAKDVFHLCYPSNVEAGAPARVCFFVNKRLDHTTWHFTPHGRDACTLAIQKPEADGERARIVIHNIYNPPRTGEEQASTIPTVRGLIAEHTSEDQIMVGDFNLHHSMWGGVRAQRAEREAEELIQIMEQFNMVCVTQAGEITYQEGQSQSTIDLCWMNVGITDRIIKCRVDKALDHDSDHYPISTILDLRVVRLEKKPSRNWKHLDEAEYRKALTRLLPRLQNPRTKSAVDKYIEELIEALQMAADQVIPYKVPHAKAREGWTEECTNVLAETKRLRRRHARQHTEESWDEYRKARNQKTRTIRKALKAAHRERVEKAAESPQAMWKLAKWARNRDQQAPSITPALKDPSSGEEITSVADKAELLRQSFFPPPPTADLEDIRTAQYENQLQLPPITEKEVLEAITTTKPLKAPGPDGIPNKALQTCANMLVEHLTTIFNRCLTLAYCPKHFRSAATIALRKSGKGDYTVPKAYRPIALLNTIGKIMDAIIARRLSFVAETYDILPATHFGGRKRKSTEHALHDIIDTIYDAWNSSNDKIASLLLLDVSGAFDNVSHARLLHDLRKRKIDESVVRWIASFLDERTTTIVLDGQHSKHYTIKTGIPQGSPLSPILYIFYNADLIHELHANGTTVTGYIDDAAILATGSSTADTCIKLATALEKAQHWAHTHASKFAPEKFQLTHFTRSWKNVDLDRHIDTSWCKINPSPTCKYLGVTLDSKLQWRAHVEEIRRKVTKTVGAMASLGNSAWGIGLNGMRKIYEGVAVPQMMYACSVWSYARSTGTPYTQATLHALENLQARAARAISGAFKATSFAALNVEAHLVPIAQRIEQRNRETLGQMLTADGKGRRRTRNRRQPRYISPMKSNLASAQQQGLIRDEGSIECIPAFVTPPWQQEPATFVEPAEAARSRHDKLLGRDNIMCIYTDGSSKEGHVGAAAVFPAGRTTKCKYMGTDTVSTVYAAELQGISLALDIAQDEVRHSIRQWNVAVFSDNQRAIRSLTRAEGGSGAYILGSIARKVRELQQDGHTVTVRWIPSHTGISGNEAADKAAKEAAVRRTDAAGRHATDDPTQLQVLQPALKAQCRRHTQAQWAVHWRAETKGKASRVYTPTPTKKVLRLHSGLSKKQSATLVQMRTGKIGLRDYLFSRNVPGIQDRHCTCREGRQTVQHLLLTCRYFKEIRREIFGGIAGQMSLRRILSERKLAIKAIRFMEQTQILGRSGIDAVE